MKPLLFVTTSLLLISPLTQAADIERGKSLHDDNCINCHAKLMGGNGTGIYTRQDRRIETLSGLKKQVKRCKNSLGATWPEDQIDDLVAYLNSYFYKFEE